MNNKIIRITIVFSAMLILAACNNHSANCFEAEHNISIEYALIKQDNALDECDIIKFAIPTNTLEIRLDIQNLDLADSDTELILPYEIAIIIYDENENIKQQITGLIVEGYMWDMDKDFILADYSGDGYLDMAIRRYIGGNSQNAPHYYWLWNTESQQFVLNETLTELSETTTINLESDGNIIAFERIRSGHYLFLTYAYKNDDFVLVLSEMREPQYNENWVYTGVKVTRFDYISGIETVTFEPKDY